MTERVLAGPVAAAGRRGRAGRVDAVDAMVDLVGVAQGERWGRVGQAVQRLERERGDRWRLKLLLPDTPDEASTVPRLVALLGGAGLAHDSFREPGGVQGMVVTPRGAGARLRDAA